MEQHGYCVVTEQNDLDVYLSWKIVPAAPFSAETMLCSKENSNTKERPPPRQHMLKTGAGSS